MNIIGSTTDRSIIGGALAVQTVLIFGIAVQPMRVAAALKRAQGFDTSCIDPREWMRDRAFGDAKCVVLMPDIPADLVPVILAACAKDGVAVEQQQVAPPVVPSHVPQVPHPVVPAQDVVASAAPAAAAPATEPAVPPAIPRDLDALEWPYLRALAVAYGAPRRVTKVEAKAFLNQRRGD